jgi:hypothetical protein
MTGSEVKENIGRKVVFKGSEYYLSAYILRKKDGKFHHQAELADLHHNTVYIVELEKVEVLNNAK